jgi:transcriptional regulator with XRE-family HTH domain
MSDIQTKIAELQKRGWTISALADELEVSRDAVDKWMAGNRNPVNAKGINTMLDQIARRKRVPKKRRYTKDSKKTIIPNQ